MVDVIVIPALAAATIVIVARSFLEPDGVYLKTVTRGAIAIAAAFALAVASSPLLGDGAGLGVAFMLAGYCGLVLGICGLACLAATARHAWDAVSLRR